MYAEDFYFYIKKKLITAYFGVFYQLYFFNFLLESAFDSFNKI